MEAPTRSYSTVAAQSPAPAQTHVHDYKQGLRDLIKFTRVDDGVGAHYLRPTMFVSPPMTTCFPKTKKEQLGRESSGIDRKYLEVDITMKGATNDQEQFKRLLDDVDDSLLEFVFNNQGVIGKAGCTRDQLGVLQKRSFRPRMNMKTGKAYADGMTCRYRLPAGAPPEDIPVFDEDGNVYTGELEFNDIISVVLRYDGCYCRAHSWFGNVWSLVAVKFLGKLRRVEDTTALTQSAVQGMFSSVGDNFPQP